MSAKERECKYILRIKEKARTRFFLCIHVYVFLILLRLYIYVKKERGENKHGSNFRGER